MIEITKELALKLLAEAVAEKGETYVYSNPTSQDCMYVHGYAPVLDETGDETGEREQVEDLTPGCLVGDVLHRAGVPLRLFERLDINYDTPADHALSDLRLHGVLEYTPEASSVLLAAQSAQDTKRSWGAALKAAYKA